MNEINNINCQELSFIDIFSNYEKIHSILIPAIQRDFAQGRTTPKATKIRKDFVTELKNYLLDGKTHSLDFIYGYGHDQFFIPLDGQQRLTTLWLLHLYLGCMSGKSDKITQFVFNYETRDSSARFCQKLLDNAGNLFTPELLKVKDKNNNKYTPSKLIKNEYWWFTKWINDPTINGMLMMLDEIDKQFYDSEKEDYITIPTASDNLFSNNKPIVFQFMSLEGFHDIDDLYIKMNARGLPLTPFEIFKSKLIEDVEKVLDKETQQQFKSDIDCTWSDTLWKYRGNYKNIDCFLERTLKVLIANESVLSTKSTISDLDALFEANDKKVIFAHNWYKQQGIDFNEELLQRLISDMSILFGNNSLLNEDAKIEGYDTYWFDIVKHIRKWIIEGNTPTYDIRLKLYAYLQYQKLFANIEPTDLTAWMRLIHNLIEATPIDNSQDMVNALKGIMSILNSYQNEYNNSKCTIDQWLILQEGNSIAFFANYQWKEEIIKAKLRLSNSGWDTPLERAEKHSYLNGQIGITLYLAEVYAGFPNSYNFAENISANDYNTKLDNILPLFTEISDANSDTIKKFAMVKAMLAKGNYMPWLSSNRKNFYNIPKHRDYSWKRLFRADNTPNVKAFECLNNIVNDKKYNANNLYDSLNAIASTYQGEEEWIKILLGEYGSNIMKVSKSGFIAFDNDNVLIYHASQRNHYHSELFTRALYEELKELYKNNNDTHIDYEPVKSGDDSPCATINNYQIYHWIYPNNDPKFWLILIKDKKETKEFDTKEEVLNYIKTNIVIK